MYVTQKGEGPLWVLDEDDNVIDGGGGTPTGRWLLTMELRIVDGVLLSMHGTSIGGDCDVLRIQSDGGEDFHEIRGHGGSLSFRNTKVGGGVNVAGVERGGVSRARKASSGVQGVCPASCFVLFVRIGVAVVGREVMGLGRVGFGLRPQAFFKLATVTWGAGGVCAWIRIFQAVEHHEVGRLAGLGPVGWVCIWASILDASWYERVEFRKLQSCLKKQGLLSSPACPICSVAPDDWNIETGAITLNIGTNGTRYVVKSGVDLKSEFWIGLGWVGHFPLPTNTRQLSIANTRQTEFLGTPACREC